MLLRVVPPAHAEPKAVSLGSVELIRTWGIYLLSPAEYPNPELNIFRHYVNLIWSQHRILWTYPRYPHTNHEQGNLFSQMDLSLEMFIVTLRRRVLGWGWHFQLRTDFWDFNFVHLILSGIIIMNPIVVDLVAHPTYTHDLISFR